MGNFFSRSNDEIPPPMSPPLGRMTTPSPPGSEFSEFVDFTSSCSSSVYSDDVVPVKEALLSPKTLYKVPSSLVEQSCASYASPTRKSRAATQQQRVEEFTKSQAELRRSQLKERTRIRDEIYAFNRLQTFLEKHKCRVHSLGGTKVDVIAGV